MSPLRTEILATLLEIVSDAFPPPPNQNPGYAPALHVREVYVRREEYE